VECHLKIDLINSRFKLFKKIIIFSLKFIMTEQTFGSKAQVWHGTAKKTSGGLTKNNLMKNKHGRIVSRRKHTMGKKSIKHLRKMGYIAKKGKFTLFRKGSRSRKMKGGMNGGPLSPSEFNGSGVGTSGVALQFVAGNAG
jgi:hypothetical protein